MSKDFHFDPETAADNILFIFEAVIKRFEQNDLAVSRYDSERGDLDHMIELTSYNAAEGYQLVKNVRENRRARRICKDENLVLKPIYDFIRSNNDKLLKDMKVIARETEKKASYRDNQKYHPRTAIISVDDFNKKRVKL
ncbi:hypothetical protein [Cohnella silvisoli]|uniref:Uncharacterized protein n=1 Tax=Cohnella silvisoli TaxID=2873699 RepID=A0ABV1L2X8_9BACL|nr:hypothetical protein [Cohnella silvisoli]MCD9026028.1 hypothetical protein [Cohnella silvisoli]